MNAENIKILVDLLAQIHNETSYCAFISYSGHIDGINYHITSSKEDYLNTIFERSFYGDSTDIEERKAELLEVLEDGRNNKALLIKKEKERIISKYKKYIEIGVPKTRAISNVAKDMNKTVKEIKQIIDGL